MYVYWIAPQVYIPKPKAKKASTAPKPGTEQTKKRTKRKKRFSWNLGGIMTEMLYKTDDEFWMLVF